MKKISTSKETPAAEPATKEPFDLECSLTSGIVKAKSAAQPELNLTITPFLNPTGKVSYHITGDVAKALQEIYENCPVGALDVLQGIKFTRSAIFALKGGRR